MKSNSVNLLPKEVLTQYQDRAIFRFWIRTAVIVVCLLAVVYYGVYLESRETNRILADSVRDTTESQRIIDTTQQLQARIDRLRQLSSNQQLLRSMHPPIAAIHLLERIRVKMEDQVQVQSIEFEDRAIVSAESKATVPVSHDKSTSNKTTFEKPTQGMGTLRVGFVVNTADSATRVLEELRNSSRFRSVDLDSPLQHQQIRGKEELSFSVRCVF